MYINRKRLSEAVGLLAKVANGKSPMPILGAVRLEAAAGELLAQATDIDRELSIRLPCEGALMPCAVSAKGLLKVLRALDGDNVEVDSDKGKVRVGNVRLNLAPVEDFPAAKPVVKHVGKAPGLLAALRTVAPSMSNDVTRHSLNGAFIDRERQRVVGCDGHRLAFVPCRIGDWFRGGTSMDSGVILSRDTVELAMAAAKAYGDEADFGAHASNDGYPIHVELHIGPATIRTRAVDAQYPEYTHVIPKPEQADAAFEISRAGFAKALKVVNAVLTAPGVKLTVNSAVRIEGHDVEAGEASVDVDAKVLPVRDDSAEVVSRFNQAYLADALTMPGEGAFRVYLQDDGAPLLLVPTDVDGAAYVVMPMVS